MSKLYSQRCMLMLRQLRLLHFRKFCQWYRCSIKVVSCRKTRVCIVNQTYFIQSRLQTCSAQSTTRSRTYNHFLLPALPQHITPLPHFKTLVLHPPINAFSNLPFSKHCSLPFVLVHIVKFVPFNLKWLDFVKQIDYYILFALTFFVGK